MLHLLRPLRPDRRPLAAVVALLAVASAGCVKPDAPGVGIKELEADIVFGIKPPEEPPPASFAPTEESLQETPELPPPLFDLPPLKPLPTFTPRGPAAKPAEECPLAPLGAAPAEAADLNVPQGRMPAVGVYRWRIDGSFKPANAPTPSPLATRYEQRLIRRVTRLTPSAGNTGEEFRYEMVQPTGGGRFTVSTFLVKTKAPSTQQDARTGQRARAGDPERGLVLEKLEDHDRNGNIVSSADFSNSSGLLLLPLEVSPGEDFASVAVDTKNQRTIELNGTVQRRERIDACGELVDGWLVEARQVFAGGAGTFERDFHYVVAPQLGAMLISERSTQVDDMDNEIKLEYRLGQLKPGPLPLGSE